MKTMISMTGEPDQLPFLPEIAELGAGIELGSYGLVGVRSERDWQARIDLHKAVRAQFHGELAIHGPFVGMEFSHIDHYIRAAVQRRMDMTFDVARELRASRIILHSGYTPEMDYFNLQQVWLQGSINFWQAEIPRWADAGIEIVLENSIDKIPDLMVQMVNQIDNPFLNFCLDIGHQHMFSEVAPRGWIEMMAPRLTHYHVHDNDSTADSHWPIGRGTIDFAAFFADVSALTPHATLCIELFDTMEVKLADLRKLMGLFSSATKPA